MEFNAMKKVMVFLAFVAVAVATSWGTGVAEVPSLHLAPNKIHISAFYNGMKVEATGEIPAGAEAAIRISGRYTELHLKKKGKVAGLLWMNVGDVTIGNVPEVFLVFASQGVSKVLDDPALNLGYVYLQKEMELEPANEDKDFIFGEFVKLQERTKTYGIFSDAVEYTGEKEGRRQFKAHLFIPPKMQQGEYKVELFAIKDGQIVGKTETKLALEQVGFPALITKFAFQHALVYGVVAVIIAVLAGLLMGVLFGGKGGAH